jgi:hypothetical protein
LRGRREATIARKSSASPYGRDLQTEADGAQKQASLSASQEQQPLSPEAEKVEDELQRGSEIADVTPNENDHTNANGRRT